jgi:hypothetical protein
VPRAEAARRSAEQSSPRGTVEPRAARRAYRARRSGCAPAAARRGQKRASGRARWAQAAFVVASSAQGVLMSAARYAPCACAPRRRALPRSPPLLLLLLLACLRCAGGSLQVAGGGVRARGVPPPPVSAFGQPRRLLSPRGAGAAGAHVAGDARDAPWAAPEHAAPANTLVYGVRRHLLNAPPLPSAPAATAWRTSPVLPSGAFVMISAKLQLQSDPLVDAFSLGVAQAPLMSAVSSLVGLDATAVAVRAITFPMLAFVLLNGTNTWSGQCTHEVEKVVAKHLGLSSWAVKVPYPAETDTDINQTLITIRVRRWRSAGRCILFS